jgi:hypothetical protein
MVAKLNLTINQGDTFAPTFVYKIITSGVTTIVDLTGYTARMKAKVDIDDTASILNLTTENGGITLGGENGTIALSVSATDTAALDFESIGYDIELIVGSTVTKFLRGYVFLNKEWTN